MTYPDFMDALVPMASQPTAMASRNWMMRRLITDSIRTDPDWNDGNYTKQPRSAHLAAVFYGIATSGGTRAYQKTAPTREAADRLLDARLAAPFAVDANDLLYQWDSSRDYDPAPGLERIQAAVLAINSADDERNPPENGIMERALARVKNARLFLIPGRRHGEVVEAAIAGAAGDDAATGDVAGDRRSAARRGAGATDAGVAPLMQHFEFADMSKSGNISTSELPWSSTIARRGHDETP